MQQATTSSELRLFLSSTFRDLQEEREHLVRKIFPEIRALCRERGVVFTEIDLRWGLTEEEGTLGKIIGACLDEVDRCRPWFIGIFGGRYGWVPPFREIYKDPDLLARYPWIEDAAADGMSIMEMEVRHALRRHAAAVEKEGELPGPLFYRRVDRRVDRSRPGTTTLEIDDRLDRLITDVAASGSAIREFRTPEELGEMVYDDLVALIDREFSREGTSVLQLEQFDHEAFAVSRRQAYIPNPDYLHRLDEFASDTPDEPEQSILVIHAPSGLGKSALLAYWAGRYRTRRPDAFVVEHYIGVGSGSGSRADIVRHILMEIRERGEITEEVPDDPEKLLSLLPEWFAMLGEEGMLLLLDGVNQLPENERDLSWIPGFIPQNVRLILTTTEPLRDELGEIRKWPEMTLDPLDVDEREAVIVRFLGEFHKGLSRERIREIASAPQTAEPLYLRTLLEELRVSGLHEHLGSTIAHYLAAGDTPALFQRVLERLEDDFGTRRVREVMSLIRCSRNGLSDTELAELTLISRLQLTLFLTALDYHLVRRSGLYTFFHVHLAQAVEARYLPDEEIKQSYHYRIGQYFSTTPVTDRRLEEEPWAWVEAGDLERLKGCITDREIFLAMSQEEWKYELIRYWREFEVGELVGGYEGMIGDIPVESPLHADLLRTLGDMLMAVGESIKAGEYLQKGLILAERFGNVQSQIRYLLSMGEYFISRGEYRDAEKMIERGLNLSSIDPGPSETELIDCMITLATARYRRGELAEAGRLFREALGLSEKIDDPRRVFESASGAGAVGFLQGGASGAEEMLLRARDIVEEQGWWTTLRGAECLNNLGALYREQGNIERAVNFVGQALETYRRIVGDQHERTVSLMMNYGNLLDSTGDGAGAEVYLRQSLETQIRVSGEDHPESARRMVQLSIVLKKNGRLEEAEELLYAAFEVQRKYLGPDHPSTLQTILERADLRFVQGNLKEALDLYTKWLPRKEAVLGYEHESCQDSRIRLELIRSLLTQA